MPREEKRSLTSVQNDARSQSQQRDGASLVELPPVRVEALLVDFDNEDERLAYQDALGRVA